MKANVRTLGDALDRPDPAVRFYLFHGPDDSGSRALAHRLLKSLGAERFVIAAGAVKGDPALLADEAGAMGLFGDKRLLWIEPASDEISEGVAGLLFAPGVESIAIGLAGALRKTSTLLKLAEADRGALAHCSYLPEGRDADRIVIDLARAEGLRATSEVAARVASAAGYDRAIIASELAKFALYLGATPEAPRDLDPDTLDRLGADSGEGDWVRIGDLALDGRLGELTDELQRLPPGGAEVIAILRSLQRRLLQLAPMRARIESGERVDGVMASAGKALFWKDKALVQRLLSQWSAARLVQAADRASSLERRLMLTPLPAEAALGEELIAIARAARR
ncbi:MAG: DNA polymerase III subunit delta [Sphingomicrobium sp.]